MSKSIPQRLNRILNNTTSGSSEIVQMINDYFISVQKNKSEIVRSILLLKIKLRHFEAVNSYLSQIQLKLRDKNELLNFLTAYTINHQMKVELIFKRIYPHLKKMNSVITLSKSRTVIEILKLWFRKNRKLQVVVCESRPKLEGRLMAESLAKIGIKTTLITDAMMSLYIPKVDAAIIGADVVLKNKNVINKVGSKSLSLLCKDYKKPFFAVTTKSKFSTSKKFKQKEENPIEIFNKKIKNISVTNIYFEEIDKKFITQIFTD